MNLKIEQILKRKFKVDLKGYDAREVDAFLDLIIQDYGKFQQIIDEKNQQINELLVINNKQKAELEVKKAHFDNVTKQLEILENRSLSHDDLLTQINQDEINEDNLKNKKT